MKRTRVFGIVAGLAVVSSLSLFFTNCSNMGFELAEEACEITDNGDPFLSYSWHLANCGQSVFAKNVGAKGVDLNLKKTWAQGIYGQGVKIRVSDDGLQDGHEDLTGNFSYSSNSRDYSISSSGPWSSLTAPPKSTSDNHGTSVAGLIAAVGWNGKGSRGVAPKASLQVANLLSSTVTQTNAKIYDQASGDFDVLNMSWGTDQNNLSDPDTTYEGFLKTAVTDNRGGKGAILVKAAGNDFSVGCHNNTSVACVGNANFDGDNKNPYTIVVSALNATGYSASYSSGGSNVWISGFGGQYGDTSPAMFTTDRTGCSAGWSQSSTSTTISFQKGGGQNSQCNYTVTFNGTSSAAPTVSGAVALILEANPQLTWRDVKYILARTAVPMDYVTTGGISHPKGASLPSGYVWEMPWIVNGAGFKFQNWYGFGKVDVDAAVKMAQKYTSNLGSYNEESWGKHTLSGLSIGIPDNSATGGQSSMVVASADNLKIESVRLKISVTHPNISELALELTSPSGTKSILVNARNSLVGISDYDNDIFLSNAFYQEKSAGTWKLRVVDALGGNTGTITSWSLNFTGGK